MRYLLVFFILLYSIPNYANDFKRIITIGGAITEIVYALEAQELLVGNDITSYYPVEAENIKKVGYQRTLSAEGILSLNPDLVILTEESGPASVLKQIEAAGVTLLKIKAGRSIKDVNNSISIIGSVLNREQEAQELIKQINIKSQKLIDIKNQQSSSKNVMFILQYGSGIPMVAGKNTAADSIINLSGAINAVNEYDGYKPLTPEAALSIDPDFILITHQGLEEIGGKEGLLRIPGISNTKAIKNNNIIIMDTLLLLGFGPRTAEAALQLNHEINKGL